MRSIDLAVFFFLRGLDDRWPRFGAFVQGLTDNDMLKAAPVLIAVWVLWFVRDPSTRERRVRLVSLLFAGCTAALFSVWLTRVLPMRPRPVFEPALQFVFAHPEGTPDWSRVSSLPSDHAAMFMALAFSMLFVSRKWGAVLIAHVLLFVMLPRAFVGLHYFWDLVAGAAIGVVFALAWNSRFMRTRVSERIVAFESVRAPAFYGCMFVVTMQIFDLFHSTRQALGLIHALGGVLLRNGGLALN